MERIDRVTGVVLLALGIGFAATALREYAYWDHRGPGPAFLPFYLGITLSVLALLLTAGVGRPAGATAPQWGGTAVRRPVVVFLASVVFVAVMPWVGMILGMGLFVLGILRGLEGFSWRTSVAVAAGTALVNYLVFAVWLRVPFPVGVLGI